MFSKTECLLWQNDTRRPADVIYHSFRKAFELSRAFSFGRGRTVNWKKWWLGRLNIACLWAQRVAMNGSASAWWPAMSKVPQRLNSCSYCLNVLISDLGPASISDVKLEGETFTMNGRTWIHWGFDNPWELGQHKPCDVQQREKQTSALGTV